MTVAIALGFAVGWRVRDLRPSFAMDASEASYKKGLMSTGPGRT